MTTTTLLLSFNTFLLGVIAALLGIFVARVEKHEDRFNAHLDNHP